MARISLKEREVEHKSKRGLFIANDGVRPLRETKREGGGKEGVGEPIWTRDRHSYSAICQVDPRICTPWALDLLNLNRVSRREACCGQCSKAPSFVPHYIREVEAASIEATNALVGDAAFRRGLKYKGHSIDILMVHVNVHRPEDELRPRLVTS